MCIRDSCPCCRSTKSFLFCIFGQFFIPCTFHRRKHGIFCVLFRWLCEMLRYQRITGTIMLACPDIQLRLFFLNLYAKELFQFIFDRLESFLLCFLCCEIKRMIIAFVAGIINWLIRILICGGCLVGVGILLAFIEIKIAGLSILFGYDCSRGSREDAAFGI